ncbi:hypothetical protein AVEN_99470-1 [Araneus ventricosus]|uniref:Uncharacterized protein n=1 Tax=Araneus ventricosus TaxID=182803 RepID=A0A4Y2TSL8_ARAVE|nr:hypothetical protein AVEN_268702-1 [Araneus ventricosus]GBO03436.1 hypothetical protein AVEN_99470-1 [Araneus ventricosus]
MCDWKHQGISEGAHISTEAFVGISGITFHVLERCRGPVPRHFVLLWWSGPNFLLWSDLVTSVISTSPFLHSLRIRILSLVCGTQWPCMISYAIIVPSNSYHATSYVLLFFHRFLYRLALQHITLHSSHQLVKKLYSLARPTPLFFRKKVPLHSQTLPFCIARGVANPMPTMLNSKIEKGLWKITFYVPAEQNSLNPQGLCFEWLETGFIADNLTNWSEALHHNSQ